MKIKSLGLIEPRIHKCDYCETQLEYFPSDTKLMYSNEKTKTISLIDCIVCGRPNEVPEFRAEEKKQNESL